MIFTQDKQTDQRTKIKRKTKQREFPCYLITLLLCDIFSLWLRSPTRKTGRKKETLFGMTHACVTVFWRDISPRVLLEYSAPPVTSVVVSSYTAGWRRRPHISACSFCSARDNSSGKGCEEVFFIAMVSSSHIVYSLQKDLEQRSLWWFDKGVIISSHHWGEISHLHCCVFVPLQRFDACSSCSPFHDKETALIFLEITVHH